MADIKFLIVRQDGKGDFKEIQAAIDAAPPGSLIEIQDNGPYNEKIVIPKEKPGLTLRGEERCWPVIHSVKGGAKIDILISIADGAKDIDLKQLVLAHLSPSGRAQRCIDFGNRSSSLLRRVVVCMQGAEGLADRGHSDVAIERSFIAGNAGLGSGRHMLRDSLWVGSNVGAYGIDAVNCVFVVSSLSGYGMLVRHCTITGSINPNTASVVDSVLRDIVGPLGLIRVLCCNVLGRDASKMDPKGRPVAFEKCFNKNPMFRSPKAFDFRLKENSPCKGKASDGGDIGCTYTPDMLAILKKALELRKKGIIKF